MDQQAIAPFSLIAVIVQRGLGSKVVTFSKDHGSSGGTIIQAHGTASSRWLKALRLDDISRDLVLMLVRDNCEEPLLDALSDFLRLGESNTGIAFALPVSHVLGTKNLSFDEEETCPPPEGDADRSYHALFAIVKQTDAEDAIEVIRSTGAPGASYINAFGSADMSRLIFNMPSFTEKAIVVMIAEAEKAREITTILSREMKIDQPGSGIIFTVPVHHVRGIAQEGEVAL